MTESVSALGKVSSSGSCGGEAISLHRRKTAWNIYKLERADYMSKKEAIKCRV